MAGGAHFTAAVTHAPCSASPSPAWTEHGWLASPTRCIDANRKSPLRSPVNTRPVRLAPWAAGARPSTTMRAAGSPKPGTGRPQYVSSRNAARFSTATCSRHATSRGQARQATTSASTAVSSACAHAAYSGSPGAPGLQWASVGSAKAPDASK